LANPKIGLQQQRFDAWRDAFADASKDNNTIVEAVGKELELGQLGSGSLKSVFLLIVG
jgi:hypothetical protein